MKFIVCWFDFGSQWAVAGCLLNRRNAVRHTPRYRSRLCRAQPKLVVIAKLKLKSTFPWKPKKKSKRVKRALLRV